MLFKTIDGIDKDLQQEKFDEFRMKLRGQAVLPADQSYNELRSLWNGMYDKKPAAIIRCLGTADVIGAVRFARENNLLMCIKSGGHNIGGLAVAEGGLMLDMSLMRGVYTDRQKKIAYTQGGCLLGDVDRETQIHGLAAVLGFVSQTGTAGLTLGGGFGYLTRRFGWTADNVDSMDLVTADGNFVHASLDENEDLFWGLRGGGGNFGVVTSINYKLHQIGPEITGGIVAWPASEAENVLQLYRSFAEDAPRDLTLVAILRPAPPAPWIPKEWHGKLVILLLACYSGKPEFADSLLAPIKKFGKPVADILIPRPYSQMQSLLDTANPKGRRYYWKSEYFPSVESEMITRFISHGGKIVSPFTSMILFQIGGALNELDEMHSPAGNRNAKYVLNITSSWEKPEDDEKNFLWTREAWNDLKEFSTGGTYINFLNEDDGIDRTRAALSSSFERLSRIKSKWDPDNFFRVNRNIKPARKSESVV